MIKEFDEFDKLREELIKSSRVVVKLSKKIIYAVHRGDVDGKLCEEIKGGFVKINELVGKSAELKYSGSYKIACQEYVEALCYYEFVVNKKIPTMGELGVSSQGYLLGLCDLSGELVRNAVNKATKGEVGEVEVIRDLVVEIYEKLMLFDFRNSELRRKFDGLKYDVKKVEDVMFQLKLKNG